MISKKQNGHELSLNFIKDLIEIIEIVGVDNNVIRKALSSKMKDFEDAIQNIAAEINGIEIILTRNKKDFNNASLKILTPTEFLSIMKG